MEGFVVSARKYRPGKFDEVVGQGHVTNTLKNAIKLGELAHAFLFSGPRGVGKTTCARILAKSINCENQGPEGDPCDTCDSCKTFLEGRSLNIHELDAASNNSVEDIRKIIEQVRYVPTNGKKSVFIIDEVHMLSTAAFNAFLKTLEEPPSYAVFILATTEKHKILPTILSRCQKFDFRRIKVNDIADHLKSICEKEGFQYEYEALQLIGLKADGALRDGLSIFDQLVSYSGKNITYQIVLENLNVLDYDYFFKATQMIKEQDHESLLMLLNEILEKGFDAKDFMVGMNEHFRNLLIAMTPKTVALLETSDNVKKQYLETAKALSPSMMMNAFQICSDAEQKLRASQNPRFLIELTLVKLAYLGQALELVAEGGEKKKLVTQAKAPSTPSSQPTEDLSPPKADNSVSESQEPPSKEETKVEEPAEKPKPSKFNLNTSKGGIPNSLDAIRNRVIEEEAAKEEEEEDEKPVAYDPSINIDPEAFGKAYEQAVQELRDAGKHSLVSCLVKDAYRLDHNKWIQIVPNDAMKKQLDLDRDILQKVREKLNIRNLILEVKVEVLEIKGDNLPYTNEEKLKLMEEKNPNLRLFMKKFDTLMKY